MGRKTTNESRQQILTALKTRGPQSAAELSEALGVTTMAVRQHLAKIVEAEEVSWFDERRAVGRPLRRWQLTLKGHERFPDGHVELAVDLIDAVQAAFGADGMRRLIKARGEAQLVAYRARVDSRWSLERQVAALCSARREEGYMAEWSEGEDGAFLLIENNCPICAAAKRCVALCSSELELFREVLGPTVVIERREHILGGDRRCVYQIGAR